LSAPVPVLSSLKRLFSQAAVYGSADVFSNLLNFLLVPIYTKYLAPSDYGTLALLFLFSAVAKVIFRMKLDEGFLRVYYDLKSEEQKRGFTFTLALFALVSGAILFLLVFLLVPFLAHHLIGPVKRSATMILLAAGDVYVGTFFFVPLTLLRIQGRPGFFSALTGGRQFLNTILKVLFVVRGGGVVGVLTSDILATLALALVLFPLTLKYSSFRIEKSALWATLQFSLPKVPHGFMIQVQNFADRKILDEFALRSEVGVYSVAYTFGMGVKFALSAFEPAWQPFVFSQIRKPSTPDLIARVATYVWAGFVFSGLIFSVFGAELLVLMTSKSAFWKGAGIIPIVTSAYVLHGAFLLTSLGIAIERKAKYYPLVTFLSASTNILLDFILIPRFGSLGAAWATLLAFTVMAAYGYRISRALYKIPYEWARLGGILLAALLTFALTQLLHAPQVAPDVSVAARALELLPTLLTKGALFLVFPVSLWIFSRAAEKEWLQRRLLSGMKGSKAGV